MTLSLLFENFGIAFRSLRANKVRSLLTVLGTTIGVFSVIMIVALVTGLKDQIRSQIVSLGADVLNIVPSSPDQNFGPGAAFATFSRRDLQEMRAARHLYRYMSEVVSTPGTFETGAKQEKGYIIGIHPDYFRMGDRPAIAGTLFGSGEMSARSRTVVLGVNIARELYGTPERAVGKDIAMNGKEFSVQGVMKKQDIKFGDFDIDDAVYIPSTTALAEYEEANIREIYAMVPDEAELARYTREWEAEMTNIRGKDKFTVLAQDDLLATVDRITNLITQALAGLASISLLVGGIGIMNIMLVTVTERTREIGIRKAVGAEDIHILTQFLTESVALSLIGGVMGILITFLVSLIVQQALGVTSLITWQTVAGAVAFSAFVGVLFGTAPAYKAAKRDPIEALRYNQ